MRWIDETANLERLEKLIFSKKINKSNDLIIWFDQLNFISLHHHFILHAWTIRLRVASAYLRRFVSSILHQYVDFALSRFTIIQSRWFFSYLLIFEIVEKSKSLKMNMRFWWNQIEETTKLGDSLIRRKNPVTIEDLDSQKNLDESWDERSVDEINKREFLYNELNLSFKLDRQQLAIYSFVSQ
jgi:hypothetical protein